MEVVGETPFIKKSRKIRIEALARVIKSTGVNPEDKEAVVKALASNREINLSSFIDRSSDKRYAGMVKKALELN